MPTRSQQLRKRHRRIFAWSLALAAVAHVAVFVLTPAFRAKAPTGREIEVLTADKGDFPGISVELVFGPPTISALDGTVWPEPLDHQLLAARRVRLPRGCGPLTRRGEEPLQGQVRLRVKASGLVDVVDLTESTGSPCGDSVMAIVAGSLWYRWLPNDRFPPPVDLVQPVTLTDLRD